MAKENFVISTGANIKERVLKRRAITWSALVKQLSKHKKTEAKGGSFFIGGYFLDDIRKTDVMIGRTLLTIDIDDVCMSVDDILFELEMCFSCSFHAYSTHSHGIDGLSSVRVIMPLSREVSVGEYRHLSRVACAGLGVDVDPCSYKPNQAMFTPSSASGEGWIATQDGDALDVDHMLSQECVDFDAADDDADDLDQMLREQPLALSDSDVDGNLALYRADGLDYDGWLTVGAALHHQFEGSDKGYAKWLAWSALSSKHDKTQMRIKYNSFGRSERLTTFASIIYMTNQMGGLPTGEVAAADENDDSYDPFASPTLLGLMSEAGEVDDVESYQSFVDKVRSLPLKALRDDQRAMIAKTVSDGFGKDAGLTKSDVKKAMKPIKEGNIAENSDKTMPNWAAKWIYNETQKLFVNLLVRDYEISREAFCAKYDRKPECVAAEIPATSLVLNQYHIPTVADQMYYPGRERLFTHAGKQFVNTYHDEGFERKALSGMGIEQLSEDERSAVQLFEQHMTHLLSDQAELQIMWDWLAHVVQHPTHRVEWAVVVQGGMGCGKTFISRVLQTVLGQNVHQVDPASIAKPFSSWAEGCLINVIEEIRISGSNRYELLDKMKPYISNKTIVVEEKYKKTRTAPNFTSYIMLTNHKDAIPICNDDRRYAILCSLMQTEMGIANTLGEGKIEGVQDYFDALFNALQRYPRAFAWKLLNHSVSDAFNHQGRAPKTNARERMIEMTKPHYQVLVEEALEEHKCAVICDEFVDVTHITALMNMDDNEVIPPRRLGSILTKLGYEPIPCRRIKVYSTGQYHRIWVQQVGAQLGGLNCEKMSPTIIEDIKNTVRGFHQK